MVNVEEILVEHLNGAGLGCEAFMDVPANRPELFVTVERTGGGHDTFRDMPQVVVQAWARSRWEASELADDVAAALWLARFHPRIARVTVGSISNFPDPDSGQARYQIFASLVTK